MEVYDSSSPHALKQNGGLIEVRMSSPGDRERIQFLITQAGADMLAEELKRESLKIRRKHEQASKKAKERTDKAAATRALNKAKQEAAALKKEMLAS